MTASISSKDSGLSKRAGDVEEKPVEKSEYAGDDSDFGGTEARRKLERRLLLKLDLRMSILVVIYILNYVRLLSRVYVCFQAHRCGFRWIVTMRGANLAKFV